MKGNVLFALVLSATPCFSQSVSPELQAESLAACSLIMSEPLTPYGFVRATLASLWYAKTAAARGQEMKEVAKETDNMFSYVTGMMRITKTSTNDFLCAKRSLRPFTTKKIDDKISTAADFLMTIYGAHITVNERMIQLLKKMSSTDPAELMDQISTLQVERSQRWSDLVQPTAIAMMMMIDVKRPDENGKATWLVITKTQKQTILDWIEQHFPEFKDGTPKDQWSDPAKTAQLFFTILNGRKCADE